MNVQRIAVIGSIAAVAAAVATGPVDHGLAGRAAAAARRRAAVAELGQLASTAEFRWDREQRLPGVDELVDGQHLTRLPTDPTTGEPYEYRITGPRQFEVCATFDRPSRSELAGDFWSHETGHGCFQFNVTDRLHDEHPRTSCHCRAASTRGGIARPSIADPAKPGFDVDCSRCYKCSTVLKV
jgi:hypothetical protein